MDGPSDSLGVHPNLFGNGPHGLRGILTNFSLHCLKEGLVADLAGCATARGPGNATGVISFLTEYTVLRLVPTMQVISLGLMPACDKSTILCLLFSSMLQTQVSCRICLGACHLSLTSTFTYIKGLPRVDLDAIIPAPSSDQILCPHTVLRAITF